MYGTSKQFHGLCEGKPLGDPSTKASQSSVRNDSDFNTVSSYDGFNSISSQLGATADSYSSFGISEIPILSQSPSQSSFSTPQWPSTQHAARSPDSATPCSASPSSSTEPPSVQCHQCRIHFNDVGSILKHVVANHHGAGRPPWSCVVCGIGCKDKRTLERHLKNQHFGEKYYCPCGPGGRRRDNHTKHIKKCQHTGGGSYFCQCGDTITRKDPRALDKHLRHIEKECPDLQPRKRGRPRKTNK